MMHLSIHCACALSNLGSIIRCFGVLVFCCEVFSVPYIYLGSTKGLLHYEAKKLGYLLINHLPYMHLKCYDT